MNKFLIVACVSLSVTMGYAQKGKNKAPVTQPPAAPTLAPEQKAPPTAGEIMVSHFVRKYSIAQRWGDYDVAKDALYDLITEYPGNDSIIFQLAYFYYENQKHTSCAVICNDLLARNPRNQAALELSAVSYESLNIKDKALQSYESLYLINSSNATLYKMAALQYDLKRYSEALVNADILLSKPQSDSLRVTFTDPQGKQAEHSLKAALMNLKGLSYKAQGDGVKAKQFFAEAVKIDPTFEDAKKNLASIK